MSHLLKTGKGFILTKQSFDRGEQSEIILWLSTDSGTVKLCIHNEKNVFFVEQTDIEKITALFRNLSNDFTITPLGLKTFNQQAVAGVYFNTLNAFYDARTILKQENLAIYESSIRLEDRYLMERFIYGSVEFIGEAKSRKNYIEYNQVKIKSSESSQSYIPKLNIVSLDIECSEYGELYSIGFYSGVQNQREIFKHVIMIQPEQLQKDNSPNYIQWVKDEYTLLKALEQTIQEIDPDIIIGWNVINFDFRLLHERAELNQLKLKLGRGNTYMRWRDSRTENNQGFVSIDGRLVIDGIAALKAESYSFQVLV